MSSFTESVVEQAAPDCGGGLVGVAIYDDRLEVTSSGTLHFGLTPEALFGPHGSLPWNPLIASVFYRRGIIEAWGSGHDQDG